MGIPPWRSGYGHGDYDRGRRRAGRASGAGRPATPGGSAVDKLWAVDCHAAAPRTHAAAEFENVKQALEHQGVRVREGDLANALTDVTTAGRLRELAFLLAFHYRYLEGANRPSVQFEVEDWEPFLMPLRRAVVDQFWSSAPSADAAILSSVPGVCEVDWRYCAGTLGEILSPDDEAKRSAIYHKQMPRRLRTVLGLIGPSDVREAFFKLLASADLPDGLPPGAAAGVLLRDFCLVGAAPRGRPDSAAMSSLLQRAATAFAIAHSTSYQHLRGVVAGLGGSDRGSSFEA